mmetsp:Transcript_106824/g.300312  ORF Transcript_106824/g.300312 Transcript_106824/m.300312 type:complete len:207 (-) Transcript_106824:2019-2639(-)
MHLGVIAVVHVRAIVTSVDHERHELLHHHVGHVQSLWTQALLVAKFIATSPGHLTTPLDVGLQACEMVRSELFVKVILPRDFPGVFLCLDRLLERILDAEERCDAGGGLDATKSGRDQQKLGDVRLHRYGCHSPSQRREFPIARQAIHAFEQRHCRVDRLVLRGRHGISEHRRNLVIRSAVDDLGLQDNLVHRRRKHLRDRKFVQR